jgi:hypothetical protein
MSIKVHIIAIIISCCNYNKEDNFDFIHGYNKEEKYKTNNVCSV